MKIISNTSIKETYVSPSCRLMPISVKLSMLTGSNDPGNRWYNGGAGEYGDDEITDNGSY